ncbi:MAG: hypothetical protein ABFD50_02255 [Smithella sp.]
MIIKKLKYDAKQAAECRGHSMSNYHYAGDGIWITHCKICEASLIIESPDISQPEGLARGLALHTHCI